MYIWNVKALAQDLKEGKVSQLDKMKYFLATTIVQMLLTSSPAQSALRYVDFFQSILFIIISAIGILICYEANSRGDNKEFIERIVCLCLPIGARILSLLFIVHTLNMIIASVFRVGPWLAEMSIFIALLTSLIYALIWMRTFTVPTMFETRGG